MSPELKKTLCSRRGILVAGCLLTLLYALFSHGCYHHDEHYQILEYAHMKLFGVPAADHLAWEFSSMMRSGVQPFAVWCLGKALLALGIYSPYLLIFLLQLLSGALSVAALLAFGRAVRDELGDERQLLVLSPDPDLAEKCGLPLRKIVWSPYPGWVVRYFNFNDWTRYSVRSKNIYEVAAPAEVPGELPAEACAESDAS